MTELSCRQCREVAVELALGVLPGVERARALSHLDHCAACHTAVAALTCTGDRLVELLPSAEPPAGFEDRVMTALAPTALRRRRWWVPAAAVVCASALLVGAWALGRHSSPVGLPEAGRATRAVLFAPLTAGGQEVGQVFLYPGRPSWIYLSLDFDRTAEGGEATSGTVRCELVRQDGSTVPVGEFRLAKGYGGWGAPVPVDRGPPSAARVIGSTGAILATAHFG
jgi:hypothetical protein